MKRLLHTAGRLLLATGALLLALPSVSQGTPVGQRGGQRGDTTLEDAMRIPENQEIQLFNATVARVRVDVIVTDSDGQFVTDLTAADFTLFEDGRKQDILDVQLVDLAAGEIHPLFGDNPARAATDAATGAASADPAGATPAANTGDTANDNAAGAARSAASDLGAVIFLVDGPSLGQQTRARFGDAWEDILAQTDALQVPRAAYMVDNVGRVQELAPLGYDLEAMRAAAETVRSAPLFGNNTRARMIEIANDRVAPGIEPEVAERIAQAKAKSFEAAERNRALATYELLTSFTDALWTRSGRTAVVWVSTGIKVMQGGPYTAMFAQAPSATAEGMGAGALFDILSPDPQIKNAQEALHRAANGSNVSFYTVDPSLLAESRFTGGDVSVAYAGGAASLNTIEVQQSLDGLRDSMRSAAAATGGKAFIHATDLGLVLEEIEQDTSRFYLVTYKPPAPDGDGEFHEIRVDVNRPGTSVRSRGGYVDHPPAERAQRLIAAALALPGSVSDLPLAAEAFTSRPAPGQPNVLMAVAVDGTEVGVMLTQAGERRVSLDIHAIAMKDNELVGESHEQLNAQTAAGNVFRLDAADPAGSGLVGFMAYEHEWTLPPGSYTLNVAAYDNVTGRIGAGSLAVEVPDEVPAWSISDPLLVTLDDAGRPQPIVQGRVMAGQNLAVFVQVYGGVQPILSGQVLLDDDTAQEQQGAKLFPMVLRQVAVDVHRGSAPLPPGMPPGRYVLQLVITDPAAGEHKIVRLPIEVVALPAR